VCTSRQQWSLLVWEPFRSFPYLLFPFVYIFDIDKTANDTCFQINEYNHSVSFLKPVNVNKLRRVVM